MSNTASKKWIMPASISTEADLKAAISQIKSATDLPAVAVPTYSAPPAGVPPERKIKAVQDYISLFEYNHTGTLYFALRKDRGMNHLHGVAKQIMHDALPIQCIEAVFLATYLTGAFDNIERFPVSFKSKVDGHVFRHIVLAVQCTKSNKWGAIGLSRKDTLMYKPLSFPSLSALLDDYRTSYADCWHQLIKIYVGFPFEHGPPRRTKIHWRVCHVRTDDDATWGKAQPVLDHFARVADTLYGITERTGQLPDLTKFIVSKRTREGTQSGTAASRPGGKAAAPARVTKRSGGTSGKRRDRSRSRAAGGEAKGRTPSKGTGGAGGKKTPQQQTSPRRVGDSGGGKGVGQAGAESKPAAAVKGDSAGEGEAASPRSTANRPAFLGV